MTYIEHVGWFVRNGVFDDLIVEPDKVCRANWRSFGGRNFQALGDTKEKLFYNLFYMISEEAWITARGIDGDR